MLVLLYISYNAERVVCISIKVQFITNFKILSISKPDIPSV